MDITFIDKNNVDSIAFCSAVLSTVVASSVRLYCGSKLAIVKDLFQFSSLLPFILMMVGVVFDEKLLTLAFENLKIYMALGAAAAISSIITDFLSDLKNGNGS